MYIKKNFPTGGYIKHSKSKIVQPVMFIARKMGIENVYRLQKNKCGDAQKQVSITINDGYKDKI